MRAALLPLLALWFATPSWADPADALPPLTRGLFLEAREAVEREDWRRARVRLQAVLRAEPSFTQAALQLAQVNLELEQHAEAAEVLASVPFDADAVELLGRIQLQQGELEAAARSFRRLQALSPEASRGVVLEAQATAENDPDRALRLLRVAMDAPDVTEAGEDLVAASEALAAALRAAGRVDDEGVLLDALVQAYPPAGPRVADRRAALLLDEEARKLAGAAAQTLDVAQRSELSRARQHFARGDTAAAREVLEALLRDAPRSPDAWAALADVSQAAGDPVSAEKALLRAIALDPLEARHEAALGDLLVASYAHRFDREAAAAYQRALRNDPANTRLHLARARALAGVGEVDAAASEVRRFLISNPEAQHADEARLLPDALRRERPVPPTLPPSPRRPESVPTEEIWLDVHRAKVLHRRGESAAAVEILQEVRRQAPGFPGALNLLAAIRLGEGQTEQATSLYEDSLALDPQQPGVLAMLIDLAPGEVATARLEEAAAAGWADAHVLLAEEAWGQWRFWEVQPHLDAYFAGATSGPLHTRARTLQEQLERWRRGGLIAGLGLGATVLVGPPAAMIWRRSGWTVSALIESEPWLARDVSRLCSAIRHEVLKHNITVLQAVADELDAGRSGPLAFAADRLFTEGGALDRFDAYIEQLEAIARRAGVRLSLRHRDPVFSGLIRGMNRLRALRRDFFNGGSQRLPGELRALSAVLNGDAYQGLGDIIRGVEVQQVGESLLQTVVQSVAREEIYEPGLEAAVSLVVDDDVAVRVPLSDLHDILGNLLRNAYQASAEAMELQIGIHVALQTDPVTFLDRAVIRVQDNAPRRVTTAIVRGRYIERGLGLTVDLISRHGGSIHVEDEPGWCKAVVVRLPAVELDEEHP